MKRLLSLPVFGALLALAGAAALSAQTSIPATGAPANTAATPRLKAGDLAPEFTVTGPKGETIRLSDYRGKIVIVDVSATWCGPCQAAMPNNDRIFRKYEDQGVVLLGVTADDGRAEYDNWIKRNASKYRFTMAFDPAGKSGWNESVFNLKYHVTGFPTMFVIGRDGKVAEIVGGGGPGEDYRLEYALARAGAKVDLASIPAEPKKDPAAPKSIPMVAKTAAIPAMGMGAPAGGGGGGAISAIPSKFGAIATGDPVPDFTVQGPDGQALKFSSFKGKPTLVHFVTSNGPQPWFTKLMENYRDQLSSVLVIFSASEKADFDKWVAAHPQPGFALAWDPAGKAWADNVTNVSFGVGMYPATFVAHADGRLVGGLIGMGDRVALLVKAMLAKAKAVKLNVDDAAAVIDLLFAVDAIRASVPAGTIVARPGPPAPARPALIADGTMAPDFLSLDLAGKPVRLADFKGKIVILDFWATWCGPCIASMPHTQQLAKEFKDQGVVVLAACTSDTRAKFDEWVPKNNAKYPDLIFACDPNESGSKTFDDRASSKLYHVSGIPTKFVIGRDGTILAGLVGYGGEDDVRTEAVLARAGVRVAAAVAAKGEAQLKTSAAEEAAAAEAAKKTAANPPAPFRENFGKLIAGQPVPDFDLQSADGQPVKFSDIARGKTVVIGLWNASSGAPASLIAKWDEWAKQYAAQGVVFLGIGGYESRVAFDAWRAKSAGTFYFPVAFDPAGKFTAATKARADMTPDEVKAESTRSREFYDRVVSMRIGGIISAIPTTIVADPQGRLVGWYAGAGSGNYDGLANLLLRAGVKLTAADMPAKVYSPEETKPAAPVVAAAGAQTGLLAVGAMAPDFANTDAAGRTVKLSDFRGKVVVLDFWATWCGPCIASMPHTQEVAANYKDQGVVVFGSSTSDARAAFEKWVAANQAKYPDFVFAHDPLERSADNISKKLYGVTGIPQQFVIDREGRVAAQVTGYLHGEVLLDAALAKAGIKVDPAIIAKAVIDQQKRDAAR